MVQVKTTNQIVSIRGRYGGSYYKTDKDGIHLQAMPRHIRGAWCSSSLPSIASYTFVAKLWMVVLVASFAAVWVTFAAIWKFTTKFGERKKISGYNWYIHYGMKRQFQGGLPFWKPPRSPTDLPDLHGTFLGASTYRRRVEDFEAIAPTGYYYIQEDFNGKPTYVCDDRPWVIWWKDPMWVISDWQGHEPVGLTYYSPGDKINDEYQMPDTANWTTIHLGK